MDIVKAVSYYDSNSVIYQSSVVSTYSQSMMDQNGAYSRKLNDICLKSFHKENKLMLKPGTTSAKLL